MPYVPRKKKFVGKSIRKPYKKNTKITMSKQPKSIASLGNGFPRKLKMTHKYAASAMLTSTAGSIATQMYRCNGLHIPNATSGSSAHQPYYYDQALALYDHNCCIASKITYYVSQTSTANLLMQVTAYVNDDTTLTITNADTLAEVTGSKRIILPAGCNQRFKITQGWSAKKYFGGGVLGNKALTGTSGADPTEQSIFVISANQPGGSNGSVDVQVEIEYIVIWSELKDIAGS